jgi:hypothetical protein
METNAVESLFPLHYYFIGIIALLTIIGLAYYLYNKQNDNTNKRVHFPLSVYLKSYKESVETWISNAYNRFLLNSYMSEGGIKTRTIPPNGSLSRMFRGETNDEK